MCLQIKDKMKKLPFLVVLGFMIGCGDSERAESERKHQETLKAIRSMGTGDALLKLTGGFGPISTPEKARACLDQRLSEWRQGVKFDFVDAIRPSKLLLARLLSFEIVGLTPKDDLFFATVNLRVELSGGPGVTGGGPITERQVHYSIFKKNGDIMRAE